MQEALQLIPAALVPAGLTVPTGIDELLPALRTLPTTDRPGEHQRLLHRMDSKFALPRVRLPALLAALAASHQLLRSGADWASAYATVYFDTSDRRFLSDHLRGRRPRHKLRVRHYLDRRLSMLEVKTKTPGNRTDKQQRPRSYGGNGLSTEEQRWAEECSGVAAPFGGCAWSTYQRLTLLGLATAGRITIDLNVALGTAGGARMLRDSVLIEVKQERISGSSSVLRVLRLGGAHPVSLSKYVAAMMTSGEHRPAARFKAVLGRYARPENWGECHA